MPRNTIESISQRVFPVSAAAVMAQTEQTMKKIRMESVLLVLLMRMKIGESARTRAEISPAASPKPRRTVR